MTCSRGRSCLGKFVTSSSDPKLLSSQASTGMERVGWPQCRHWRSHKDGNDWTEQTSAYLPIPAGYVAATLPTGEQQGVGGYIHQGDYINVIAVTNTALFSPRNPRSVARTVFSSVHVIRVGPQSLVQGQGQAQGVSSSITVVMTQCDWNYMEWLLVKPSTKYPLPAYDEYNP